MHPRTDRHRTVWNISIGLGLLLRTNPLPGVVDGIFDSTRQYSLNRHRQTRSEASQFIFFIIEATGGVRWSASRSSSHTQIRKAQAPGLEAREPRVGSSSSLSKTSHPYTHNAQRVKRSAASITRVSETRGGVVPRTFYQYNKAMGAPQTPPRSGAARGPAAVIHV
ncbi:hypothetical protein CPC08DRAFT_139215 [Agrocybe pediades]|nr:hypothetical protein CPC08DRAFT_139215 [Agrocybe pediades]